MFNVFETVAVDSREVKPGFHMIAMIATIAVITAIAEKKKESLTIAAIIAIIWKPLSSDGSDNDR